MALDPRLAPFPPPSLLRAIYSRFDPGISAIYFSIVNLKFSVTARPEGEKKDARPRRKQRTEKKTRRYETAPLPNRRRDRQNRELFYAGAGDASFVSDKKLFREIAVTVGRIAIDESLDWLGRENSNSGAVVEMWMLFVYKNM